MVSDASMWRLASRCELSESGCVEWMGLTLGGYGLSQVAGAKSRLVHRIVYAYAVGDIATGLHLDHLCGNRRCVNVMHLEPVTPSENARRRSAWSLSDGVWRCPSGHEMTGRNVKPKSGGRKTCRECHNTTERNRSHRARRPV